MKSLLIATTLTIAVHAQPAVAVEGPLYYPPNAANWEAADPAALDWDLAALDRAADFARDQNSSALIVLHRGRIVTERYWDITDPARRYKNLVAQPTPAGRVREDVASAQKSVTSFLCGVAEQRLLLDIAKPVTSYLGQGWSKADAEQEIKITPFHLLSMTSGLDSALRFRESPGTRWQYNTNAYAVLSKILAAVSGMDINELTRAWLTGPVGMADSKWEVRRWLGANADANNIGFVTSARDLARFGHLLLANGFWNGTDILQNAAYLERATHPSQTLNPAYGLLFWLNGQSAFIRGRDRGTGSINPAAPRDMYMAAGALNRRVYILPADGIVVVRLGDQPSDLRFDQTFWTHLSDAIK